MCNRYQSTPRERLPAIFGKAVEGPAYEPMIVPLRPGPFVRADRIVVGQWGLIPPGSRTCVPQRANGTRLSTNNCRNETMATAWTFRDAWARGQRCLIPADSFDEPNWTSGRNVWWRFERSDGQPWALAGLWSEWTDPATGQVVPSYTLLTQNCDGHPVLGLMHKPDPALPPDRQDKRAVVPIERADWERWLLGAPDEARSLIRVPPVELLRHGPVEAPRQDSLDL